MTITWFEVDDKDEKFHLFKETFLLAEISIDITLRMSFIILKNISVNFKNWKLK